MPALSIDGHPIEVPAHTTILEAARQLGIAIPTLCWLEGHPPSVSCMLCAVHIHGVRRLVPACATPVAAHMRVETRTEAVLANRRMVLELLFSHHTGDCEAPCSLVCPAGLDVPRLLRLLQEGDANGAGRLADAALVLPRTLGCICPAPCEKACRRRQHDAAVAIPALHRTAAAAGEMTAEAVPTGRRAAVVGAGPAGLAAAAVLRRHGHAVTLYDDHPAAGGMLRYGVGAEVLPAADLEADLAHILGLGVHFVPDSAIADAEAIEGLRRQFDAVILAAGSQAPCQAWGLAMGPHGLVVDRATQETSMPGVFAAGGIIREIRKMAVRAVASGKTAAEAAHRFLLGETGPLPGRLLNVSMGPLREGEMERLLETASPAGRALLAAGREALSPEQAAAEAARCLHCDCRAARDCPLRIHGSEAGADAARWRSKRPAFEHDLSHPDIIYEPGKCIACGLCIQVAEAAGEPLGNAFLGRGIAVRVAPPLRETLGKALGKSTAACVAACPTGALAWRREPQQPAPQPNDPAPAPVRG